MKNDEIELQMMHCLETMDNRLTTIRAGRANPAMLNGINVEYYGTPTPLQSLANITVPEARTLIIKPFDKGCLKDIVRAINEADLGINPTDNGESVIMSIPPLTEERRKEYVKQAKEIAEETKIALRKVANESIKDDDEITEDEEKRLMDEVQKLINEYNKKVEDKFKEKETELMQV
jgi:ribosome recycling factor